MKKLFFYPAALLVLAAGVVAQSCSKGAEFAESQPETRAAQTDPLIGMPEFLRIGGVDLWDANPLNAGTYFINDSIPFFDVVIVSHIQLRECADHRPCLGWESYVQAVLNNMDKYVRPLQNKGIKVLLAISGYIPTGWGLANMIPSDADRIAAELAEMVETYGFDGLCLEDEWTSYGENKTPPASLTAYSYFIGSMRAKLAPGKLLYLKDTGTTKGLSSETLDSFDCAWTSIYSYYSAQSCLAGMPREKYAPLLYEAGSAASRVVKIYVTSLIRDGYRSMVFSRLTTVSGQKLFQYVAEAAFGEGTVVTQNGETYEKEW